MALQIIQSNSIGEKLWVLVSRMFRIQQQIIRKDKIYKNEKSNDNF